MKHTFFYVATLLTDVYSPLIPISVVLLDTTSVLGELGWKTYPINGVRTVPLFHIIYCHLFSLTSVSCSKRHSHCCIGEINYINLMRIELAAKISICCVFRFLLYVPTENIENEARLLRNFLL